jgi:hypothetical protein
MDNNCFWEQSNVFWAMIEIFLGQLLKLFLGGDQIFSII